MFYVSPPPVGKRHRCRVDAIIALGLSSYSKTIKHMTRDEIADMAIENREKQFIAYQFDRLGNECKQVIEEGNEIRVVPLKEEEELTVSEDKLSSQLLSTNDSNPAVFQTPARSNKLKELYFGYGNVTILSWGKVSKNPAFHTRTQIYPIGLKFIRTEVDVALDRTVDCLCEILTHPEISPNNDNEMTVTPLFRITICWLLGRKCEKKVIRVYEGTTPQMAWQAAMLETVGISDTGTDEGMDETVSPADAPDNGNRVEEISVDGSNTNNLKSTIVSVSTAASTDGSALDAANLPSTNDSNGNAPNGLPMNASADESSLRQKLMDLRKEYMYSLHKAQVTIVCT